MAKAQARKGKVKHLATLASPGASLSKTFHKVFASENFMKRFFGCGYTLKESTTLTPHRLAHAC